MRKFKERDERKRTLDTRIYPVVWIATKALLRPRCRSTHEECRFWQSSLFREHNHSHFDPTLIPIFTKGDCPRRRGLRPPHKVVDAAPHQAGGSLTCRRATKAPRRPAHRDTTLVHSRTTAEESKPCLITHSRDNLALTLIKLVLRTKNMIYMLLDGLEVFLGVCMTSSNSSKLQMAEGAHIYRPPTQESPY